MPSPLMRGEWIEMKLAGDAVELVKSPLMRGEWIEILWERNKLIKLQVSPHARGVD